MKTIMVSVISNITSPIITLWPKRIAVPMEARRACRKLPNRSRIDARSNVSKTLDRITGSDHHVRQAYEHAKLGSVVVGFEVDIVRYDSLQLKRINAIWSPWSENLAVQATISTVG